MRLVLPLTILFGSVLSSCPDHMFLGCVLRLKAHRLPFERNILSIIFNIATEARLLHTCRVYGSILPCFREKILECGDEKQRRTLNEVGKMLMFMCSPFSLQRQRLLMKHQKCISGILALPATTGCKLNGHYHYEHLKNCRKHCNNDPSNFICLMKTWISEQNTCALKDIEDKCGNEAGQFYKDLQTTVFEPSFPVLCEYDIEEKSTVTAVSSLNTTVSKPNTKKVFKKKKIHRPVEDLSYLLTNRHNTTSDTLAVHSQLLQNSVSPSSPLSVPVTQMSTIVWTKKPLHGNKPIESKTPSLPISPAGSVALAEPFHPELGEFVLSTSIPPTSPKSIKVLNLIRSFLPGKIPAGFESFFQSPDAYPLYQPNDNSLEFFSTNNIRKAPRKLVPPITTQEPSTALLETPTTTAVAVTKSESEKLLFKTAFHSTTPSEMPTLMVEKLRTTSHDDSTMTSNTTTPPIHATEKMTYYSPPKVVKWKPWYLSANDVTVPKN